MDGRVKPGHDELSSKLIQQIQPNLILQHDPDHAQRRAAQRVRVLRARRLLVDGPEAHQHVELVR